MPEVATQADAGQYAPFKGGARLMVRLRRGRRPGPTGSTRTQAEDARWRAFKAEIQGERGERDVRAVLDATGLPVLHDVVLPAREGRVTQIDHLVLCASGILVIETKRLGGVLTGHPEDERWEQRFDGERPEAARRLIFSPLRQNAAHCRAVYEIVRHGHADVRVWSRVVMTGSARLCAALGERTERPEALALDLARIGGTPIEPDLRMAWARVVRCAEETEARRSELFARA